VGLFAGTKWETVSQCPACGLETERCKCPSDLADSPSGNALSGPVGKSPEKQTARLRVEKRKAKRVVTVVAGLSSDDSDLAALLAKLKSGCGAGGTLEGENLVIQGDQAERVAVILRAIGYRVKP
jgi:translation initiation factor 1